MLGGFLKGMNDSLKQNRDLRNKRKSLKDIYEHEHKSHTDHFNEADVNERVSLRLKWERKQSSRNRRLSVLLFLSIIIGFIIVYFVFESAPERFVPQKKEYFRTIYFKKSDREQLRVDYYKRGGKAAETKYQDSLRHQNSESYYPSGEQFRSALYYKDSLLKDLYFFKNGDTIKNFPHVTSDKVYHLKLLSPDSQIVSFDYFNGKILPDTYKQSE